VTAAVDNVDLLVAAPGETVTAAVDNVDLLVAAPGETVTAAATTTEQPLGVAVELALGPRTVPD